MKTESVFGRPLNDGDFTALIDSKLYKYNMREVFQMCDWLAPYRVIFQCNWRVDINYFADL